MNMYVGNNAVSNYGNYDEPSEGAGANEDAHCCCPSQTQGGGFRPGNLPVGARDDRGQDGGEAGGEETMWVTDPNTGYLVAVPVARGDGGQGGYGDGAQGDGGAPDMPYLPPPNGSPFVPGQDGNLYVQAMDGNYYPVDLGDGASGIADDGPVTTGPEDSSSGSGEVTWEEGGVTAGEGAGSGGSEQAEVIVSPETGLALENADGEVVPFTPEMAQQRGREFIETLATNGEIDPARAEAALAGTDPASLEKLMMIGIVHQTGVEVSGGSEAFADRAVHVLLTDAGSSIGNADKLLSQMLTKGDISIEAFVDMANNGEFLATLLPHLEQGADGVIPQEGVDTAVGMVHERAETLLVESGTETPGTQASDSATEPDPAATGEATGTQSTTASVDDGASGSGDVIVDQYLTARTAQNFDEMTPEEARTLAGDAGFVAALQPYLQLNEAGRPVDVAGADTLTAQALQTIRGGIATEEDGTTDTETAATGTDGVSGTEGTDSAQPPDAAAVVMQYLDLQAQSVQQNPDLSSEHKAMLLGALEELAGDEEFRASLEPHLAIDPETGRPTDPDEAGRLTNDAVKEKLQESQGGEESEASREEIEATASVIQKNGPQVGNFLGLSGEDGRLLGTGSANIFAGIQTENYQQTGTGVDQVADSFGLDTGGLFGTAGQSYDNISGGIEAIDDGDWINGVAQIGVGGYQAGKLVYEEVFGGGGDDDILEFGDFETVELDSSPFFDSETNTYDLSLDGVDVGLAGDFDTDSVDLADTFETDISIDDSVSFDTDSLEIGDDIGTIGTDTEISIDTDTEFAFNA